MQCHDAMPSYWIRQARTRYALQHALEREKSKRNRQRQIELSTRSASKHTGAAWGAKRLPSSHVSGDHSNNNQKKHELQAMTNSADTQCATPNAQNKSREHAWIPWSKPRPAGEALEPLQHLRCHSTHRKRISEQPFLHKEGGGGAQTPSDASMETSRRDNSP